MQFKTVEKYYSPVYSGQKAYKKYIGLQQGIKNATAEIEHHSTLLAACIKRLKDKFTDIDFWKKIQYLGGLDRISYSDIIDLQSGYLFDNRTNFATIISDLLEIEFAKIAKPSDEEKTNLLYLWLREQNIISSPTKQATIWDDSSFKNKIEKLYEIDEAIIPSQLTSILTEIKSAAQKYSDLSNLTKEITERRTHIIELKSKLKTNSYQLDHFHLKEDAKKILSEEFKKAIQLFGEEINSITDAKLNRDFGELLKAMERNENQNYSFDDLINEIGSYYAERLNNYKHDLIAEIKATWSAHRANLELIKDRDFTNKIIAEHQPPKTAATKFSPPPRHSLFPHEKNISIRPSVLSLYFNELDKLNDPMNFNIENKTLIQTLYNNLKKEADDYVAGTKDLIAWQKNSLALIETHLKIGSELRGYAKPIVQNSLNVLINILACVGMLIIGYIIYAAIKGPFSPVDFSNETEKLLQATSLFIQKMDPDETKVIAGQALGSPGSS
ncbi:MAG: hypothetical protein LCH30_00965 [Proteobacteria bacterium]|nr:hypothetical protein [Pseudomonadota bacterium]